MIPELGEKEVWYRSSTYLELFTVSNSLHIGKCLFVYVFVFFCFALLFVNHYLLQKETIMIKIGRVKIYVSNDKSLRSGLISCPLRGMMVGSSLEPTTCLAQVLVFIAVSGMCCVSLCRVAIKSQWSKWY